MTAVVAAIVAFILTLWINMWTVVDDEPQLPTPQPAAPVDVADRYAAADRVDRGTERDPLPEPVRVSVPTPPPPPEPEPEPVAAPAPAPQAPVTTGGSSGLPSLLLFIRDHESGGNYAAYNGSGCEGYGCGGAYQMHALYAPTWAARAGYPGMGSNAATWPPEVQDAVALDLFYSTNPDGAHWCNWVDYC